jgi:hypothetical protein
MENRHLKWKAYLLGPLYALQHLELHHNLRSCYCSSHLVRLYTGQPFLCILSENKNLMTKSTHTLIIFRLTSIGFNVLGCHESNKFYCLFVFEHFVTPASY